MSILYGEQLTTKISPSHHQIIMTEALIALLVSPKWILQKIQINVILKVHINIVLTVYTPVLFLFDEGLSCILFQCEYSFK